MRVFLIVHTESQLGTVQVMVKLILVGMTTLCILYFVVAEPSERLKRWTWDAGVLFTLAIFIYLMIRSLVFREPFPDVSGKAPERAERMPQRRTRKHKQSRK